MTITARRRQDGKTSYTVQVFNRHLGKKMTVGTFHRKSDAEAAQRHAMVEIQNQGFVSKFKDITVGDMIEDHLRVQSVQANTLYNYRLFLERFRDYVGSGTSIRTVGAQEVELFLAHMKAKGYSGNVVNLNRNALSAMFRTAIRYGYITVNPCDLIRKPKSEGGKEPRAISIEEHRRLIAQMPEHFRILVEVWPRIAARPSEMYGLKVKDFSPKEKTLRIERQFRKGVDYGPLKHDASPRTLHLDDTTCSLLKRQVRQLGDRSVEAPLFPSYRGGPIDRSWFPSRVFRKAKIAAEIQGDVTPHSLRHTGATWLLESGASVAYTARHLGHKNPAVTMRYYAGVLDQVDRSAMSRLQQWHHEMVNASSDEEAARIAEAIRHKAAMQQWRERQQEILEEAQKAVAAAIEEEGFFPVMERLMDSMMNRHATTFRLHSGSINGQDASEQQE